MAQQLENRPEKVLPCPFCGFRPRRFGRAVWHKDSKSKEVVETFIHPIKKLYGGCALQSLVFPLPQWNKRLLVAETATCR